VDEMVQSGLIAEVQAMRMILNGAGASSVVACMTAEPVVAAAASAPQTKVGLAKYNQQGVLQILGFKEVCRNPL
jgi:hypothetical protein